MCSRPVSTDQGEGQTWPPREQNHSVCMMVQKTPQTLQDLETASDSPAPIPPRRLMVSPYTGLSTYLTLCTASGLTSEPARQ